MLLSKFEDTCRDVIKCFHILKGDMENVTNQRLQLHLVLLSKFLVDFIELALMVRQRFIII